MKSSFFRLFPLVAVGTFLFFVARTATPVTFSLTGEPSVQIQPQASTATTFSWNHKYDVISIKPAGPVPNRGPSGYGSVELPDGLRIGRATLRTLINIAYGSSGNMAVVVGFNNDQILGAPEWFDSEAYTIDAKMDTSVMNALNNLNADQRNVARQLMLRALLTERFKLAARVETRDRPVYFLEVAKGGPKLKKGVPRDQDGMELNGAHIGSGSTLLMTGDGGSRKLIVRDNTLDFLVRFLSGPSGRHVLDKTGLTDKYDFQLQWMPDNGSVEAADSLRESSWPTLLTALQEQLGLQLVSGKGPVPVLVIDHAERPTAN
jgi:uncharacterized protein (TIGR03435 family)